MSKHRQRRRRWWQPREPEVCGTQGGDLVGFCRCRLPVGHEGFHGCQHDWAWS